MASSFRNFLPFTAARTAPQSKKAEVLINDTKTLAQLVKIVGLALGIQGGGSGRANFEPSPYNLYQIIQAIDTDSYVNQAFRKYSELLWKEGWEIFGDSQDTIDYLYNRINLMELVMRRPFQELLIEIGDQLVKFANAFVVKARGDIGHLASASLTPLGQKVKLPIAGYYVIPAQTVEILRDPHNQVLQYRQKSDNGGSDKDSPVWDASEVIHFYVDRKPGRAFGTPFIVSGIDDVVALRQIEEDVQNLVHRELFPLYKYKVGTETMPAEPEEIEQAAAELANLRTEGGLILPDRHDVEVIGAQNTALDATGYLAHFQQRVVSMLGMAAHHLGITNSTGGNRSVTDRLDIALYDKVKHYQKYMSEMIRLLMFTELLYEGGYDPINTPEDRCTFKFREIDMETQLKRENHVIQKWLNNLIDINEARLQLGEDIEVDESLLFLALQARMSPDAVTTIKSASGGGTSTAVRIPSTPAAAQLPSTPTQATKALPAPTNKSTPSTGGKPNAPNNTKAVGNKSRPQNQHGTRPGPIVRHSDDDWLNEMVELIDDDDDYDRL